MGDGPRYATLRDYLRVLRERRFLIVAVTLVFAGAALGLSLAAEPEYSAEASLALRDPRQDLDFFGAPVVPRQTAQERATRATLEVTSSEVQGRVVRALGGEVPEGSIDANVEATTTFVVIQARSPDAEDAATLANAFARQTRSHLNSESREELTRAARALRREQGQLPRTDASVFQRAELEQRIAELRFLAESARPAELVQLAGIPSTPDSPLPLRNTILGGILGLTLGILAAFVRDSLDRRLRGTREIQAELSWPVIGHVRDAAMGQPGFVAEAGSKDADEADLEAFRILRSNLRYLDVDDPPTTIAVTSGLPEEGKSTVAAQLACASAAAGQLTLIVECDLRRPSLPGRLGINAAPGLGDYLLGDAGPKEILRNVPLRAVTNRANGDAPDPPAVVCIPAGSFSPRPAELLGSQRFQAFLDEVSRAYDLVVLDTSPMLSVGDTLEIIPHVDAVLACVRAGQTTREEVKALRTALERFPPRPTGVVVTGVRAGDEADFGYYSYTYAYGAVAERA